MDLPDNYFRDRSPADIIAKVATITLANISLLGSDELRRIGWLNNPIIDILYGMTSAGVWIARTDTSGRVTSAYEASIYDWVQRTGMHVTPKTICAASTSTSANLVLKSRVAIVTGTLVNGILADTPLVPALAGYYGVIDSIRVLMVTAPHDGTLKLTFQDEDNTALLGGGGGAVALTMVAGVINTQLADIKLAQATYTDNKILEVDMATGADGAGDAADDYLVTFYIEYHYET